MEVSLREGYLDEVQGRGRRYFRGWAPEGTPRAVLQIAHGMAEHSGRYDDFMHFLAERGIVAFCMDHAGHGRSARTEAEYGFFGDEGGMAAAIGDMRRFTQWLSGAYPNIPLMLMGHSMGSFMVRQYLAQDASALSGAVIMGTGGVNKQVGMGIMLAKLERLRIGRMGRSKLIDKLAFGGFNKPFAPARTPYDWLSRDEAMVDAYIADPACGFAFTAQGYLDLFELNRAVNSIEWARKLPPRLPLLLVSGDRDPVGGMGEGVRQVADWLKATGHGRVALKLFPGARHEVLNETNRQEVYEAIACWLERVLAP